MSDSDSVLYDCCRAIVRMVKAEKLQAGDKLPSQETLRLKTKFSNNSISPAMEVLSQAGYLKRQRRSGTVLIDPTALPTGLWRIAFTIGQRDNHPGNIIYSIMHRIVYETLLNKNCVMKPYSLDTLTENADGHQLSEFGNLSHDLNTHKIDGVLTLSHFNDKSLKKISESCSLLELTKASKYGIGISLDAEDLIFKATTLLKEKGCDQPTLVISQWLHNKNPEVVETFKANCNTLKQKAHVFCYDGHDYANQSDRLMNQLKNSSLKEANSLIVMNDMLALEVCASLLKNKIPMPVVIQGNKEIPLSYAVPSTILEYDMENVINSSIDLLLNSIQESQPLKENIFIKAQKKA